MYRRPMPLSPLFNTNNKGAAKAASGKENMRAIFIDAVNGKVEEIQVENELHAIYQQLGCNMIEVVPLGNDFLLICDEEGRLRDLKVGFRLADGEGIAGNGLIVCDNGSGDFTDSRIPAGVVECITTFLDLEKEPLPPPACGFAVAASISPKDIDKARQEAQKNFEQNL